MIQGDAVEAWDDLKLDCTQTLGKGAGRVQLCVAWSGFWSVRNLQGGALREIIETTFECEWFVCVYDSVHSLRIDLCGLRFDVCNQGIIRNPPKNLWLK